MTELPDDEIGGVGSSAERDAFNFGAYAQYREERSKRVRAEAEAKNWREEAISHRRRLGIPAGGVYARFPRLSDQTTEPESGSDNRKEDR